MYQEILEDWADHGPAVIAQVREKRPELYLQAVIRLVSTAHDLTVDDIRLSISELSTDELADLVGAKEKAA